MIDKIYTCPKTGYLVDSKGRVLKSLFVKQGIRPTAYAEYKMREHLKELGKLGLFPNVPVRG